MNTVRACQAVLAAVVLLPALSGGIAWADTFKLSSGGTIEGHLLNPDESPRRQYIVRTASGGKITLQKNLVVCVIAKTVAERRYDALLPKMPNSVDGNWKMAEWCRREGLEAKRRFHLEQVIKLDSDHQAARRGLGFTNMDGEWIKSKEWMKQRGFVFFKGGWRTQQDVALDTHRKQVNDAQTKWIRKVRSWQGRLGGKNSAEVRRAFQELRDPFAAKGLAELLDTESNPAWKLIYIDTLAKLDSTLAVDALIRGALEDDLETIRDACVLELEEHGKDRAVARFTRGLASKDNVRVNRSAIGLGRLKDPSAISPLIKALQTEHKFLVRTLGGGPGSISPTFGNDGSGGISVGGGGPKLFKRKIQNAQVLGALLAMTEEGVNFRYDEQGWADWYAQQRRPAVVNLRRDE